MTSNPKSDPYAVPPFDRGNLVVSVISAVLVVVAAVVGGLLVWSVRDQLSEVVATHWGADGRADGFTRVADSYVINLVTIVPFCLFLVVLGGVMKQGRLLGPLAAATAVFMSTVMNGSVIAQRGLTLDEVRESQFGIEMLIGFGLALMVGVALGLTFRRRPSGPVPAEVSDTEPRLLVDHQVMLAWTGTTTVPRVIWIILGVSALACLIPAVMSALAGSWSTAIRMLVTAAFVLTLGAAMAANVTIDGRGVRVRGIGVIPWVTVPLDQIAGASVKNVSPMGDFGGWGLRVGLNGEKGFVTSNGPALRVDQGDEPAVVITVNDAETATATLNTLVGRRSGGHNEQS